MDVLFTGQAPAPNALQARNNCSSPQTGKGHDILSSLMHMADSMESLLPPGCDISTSSSKQNTPAVPPLVLQPTEPLRSALTDCLSSVTKDSVSDSVLDTDQFHRSTPRVSVPSIEACHQGSSSLLSGIVDLIPGEHGSCCTPTAGTNSCLELPTNLSPCAVRDLAVSSPLSTTSFPALTSSLSKTRKVTRKQKTYPKPVAPSRFCHICSRMPRRGQGHAVCRRMADGLCRKIVCEQCVRDLGWNFEEISVSPSTWLCPHCAGSCPERSQCHIYNRINARRKSASPPPVRKEEPGSLAETLELTDALMGPYACVLDPVASPPSSKQQLLQPPPNFRLNLPDDYHV